MVEMEEGGNPYENHEITEMVGQSLDVVSEGPLKFTPISLVSDQVCFAGQVFWKPRNPGSMAEGGARESPNRFLPRSQSFPSYRTSLRFDFHELDPLVRSQRILWPVFRGIRVSHHIIVGSCLANCFFPGICLLKRGESPCRKLHAIPVRWIPPSSLRTLILSCGPNGFLVKDPGLSLCD